MRFLRGHINLYTKFAILFVGIVAVSLTVGTAWIRQSQEAQVEREMLETTRVLAQEMDAVWEFMETNQSQFKLGSDGTYNLYCVVAAKAVSRIFTRDSDYVIHYTNTTTRKPDDAPDDFELEALEALKSDPSLEYYYGFDERDGTRVFRYMEPVYITESCLECHGDPAGEIDIKGYPKEGMQLGDIAGVASITMPTQTFDTTLGENVLRESMLLFLVLASGLAVIFFGISRLVTRPLKKLQVSMGHIEEGRFDEGLASLTVGNNPGERDEIADLTKHFRSMACQLKSLCENLSTQVSERTAQLKEANDILEEQRAHLEQNNRKLLEDNRYKTDFLSIMSHELRTPLTSVLAFVDVLANTYEPRDANEKKIVDEIASNTQVILSIVNNILEAARMEAGKQTLNLDEVDLFDLVPMVKEQTLALAEKKGIEMTVSLDRTMPVISADEEKLRRILENLVSNAIKFTGEGGSVRISALHDAERGMAVLRVEDNGQGISPEDLEHVFDSFIQGTSQGSHIGGGSGLGLSVVKQLAELHGGWVEVDSREGVGSAFSVWVPTRAGEGGNSGEDGGWDGGNGGEGGEDGGNGEGEGDAE